MRKAIIPLYRSIEAERKEFFRALKASCRFRRCHRKHAPAGQVHQIAAENLRQIIIKMTQRPLTPLWF